MSIAWHEIYKQTFAASGDTPEVFDAIIQGWWDADYLPEETAMLYMAATERIDLTRDQVQALVNKQLDHQRELVKIAFGMKVPATSSGILPPIFKGASGLP